MGQPIVDHHVDEGDLDPLLAEIVAAWPTLPESLQADIVAMVRARR